MTLQKKFQEVEKEDFILNPEKEFSNIKSGINSAYLSINEIKNSCRFYINSGAQTPMKATKYAACFDISAHLVEGRQVSIYDSRNKKTIRKVSVIDGFKDPYINIGEGQRALIPTGLRTYMPPQMSLRLHPRSGLSIKSGINLANCQGVVDSDYVNEIFIPIINNTKEIFNIRNGDRIAQAEFVKTDSTYCVAFSQNHDGSDLEVRTNRVGGFGSSGK